VQRRKEEQNLVEVFALVVPQSVKTPLLQSRRR
jgi:hypothetical protein